MTDLARGALLAQTRLVGGVNAEEVLLTAVAETEVRLVMAAPGALGEMAEFSLFHDDAGSVLPLSNNHALLLGWQLTSANQGPILAAQSVSAGIHLSEGGQLAARLDSGTAVTLSIYGVTNILQPPQ